MLKFKQFINLTEGKKMNKKEYQKFFKSMLKKYKVKDPMELGKKERKKFFDEIDKAVSADSETD